MIQVSVIITSYNRASTVARAIKSVLSQRVKFRFQVVIIDDGSTDNSVEVIRKSIGWNTTEMYGNQMAYVDFLPCNHFGLMPTFIRAFKECKGKYIAFCDCDDYWIDPEKLQKQYDHMELNPQCGLCLTRVALFENGETIYPVTPIKTIRDHMTFDNLLRGNSFIYAQSYFMRKSVFDQFIKMEWYSKMIVWDYPIVLELIKKVRFDYMDFYTAVYTVQQDSFTHAKTRADRFKYITGQARIKCFFIRRYGCKIPTAMYLVYWFARSMYSIIFKRWYR